MEISCGMCSHKLQNKMVELILRWWCAACVRNNYQQPTLAVFSFGNLAGIILDTSKENDSIITASIFKSTHTLCMNTPSAWPWTKYNDVERNIYNFVGTHIFSSNQGEGRGVVEPHSALKIALLEIWNHHFGHHPHSWTPSWASLWAPAAAAAAAASEAA